MIPQEHADMIACPACGDTRVRHSRVSVLEQREDAVDGTCVEISDSTVCVSRVVDPRHGIIIEFACECCGGRFELHIAQREGTTLISTWREDLSQPEVAS